MELRTRENECGVQRKCIGMNLFQSPPLLHMTMNELIELQTSVSVMQFH